MAETLARLNQSAQLVGGTLSSLTSRELEIAKLEMANEGDRRQARHSPGTVKIHLQSIYDKLDITSRVELANFVRVSPVGGR